VAIPRCWASVGSSLPQPEAEPQDGHEAWQGWALAALHRKKSQDQWRRGAHWPNALRNAQPIPGSSRVTTASTQNTPAVVEQPGLRKAP